MVGWAEATMGAAVSPADPTWTWAQDLARFLGEAGSPHPVFWVLALGVLGLVPFAAMLTTCFVKFLVVLSILRSAIGTQQVPPAAVLTGLAGVLSLAVMTPVVEAMSERSSEAMLAFDRELRAEREDEGREPPPRTHEVPAAHKVRRIMVGISAGVRPLADFLSRHAEPEHVEAFLQWARQTRSEHATLGNEAITADHLSVLIPAFITSELQSAFKIGFVVFVPFLVIDLAVGVLLMALGMQMLAPTSISLPFKLLLFVLMDGWLKLTQGLLGGYA
ncbi:MAG: EscR/YscR/HrcR family type III secretion system export apparatus protein [Myxococcota bacterium]